ncbi:MAG: hypothetical protein JWO23_2109, partial [Solirubrobacterales bacterium]|nr:hypothetical protein [Solirubrobacterales bacterium]
MFVLTTLAYPVVLCVLCLGAGLLVDRASGAFLPFPLLLPVGAAALIAVSQLSSYLHALAPATPYLIAAVALAGLALGASRTPVLVRRVRERPWPVIAAPIAYAIALAPVFVAGRPTFSSYMALSDSAVHMLGADYLIRHGQDYAHLDLRNSYGQFVNDYYNSGYPSGADTLFGASTRLLRLPLIWTFQPFNAFVLAAGVGPAWLLARRMRLDGPLAALAALTAVLPALVYGYELLGSIKELVALTMILTLGGLVVGHRSWLHQAPARAIPFALVVAAGVSALGVAFGAWALAAVAVLAVIAARDLLAARLGPARLLWTGAAGALTLLVAAWPTWAHASRSLRVAQDIASTTNPGNLHAPLQTIQVLGVWLRASYKLAPGGGALVLTHLLVAVTLLAALLGGLALARTRAYALAGWIACMLLAWLVVSLSVTTWAGAKTLVLTSPVVLLLAWAGVGALSRASPRALPRAAAWLGALAIAGGVLASDALQYHGSNLAPTARYDELASLNSRFAGKGPALFTDFDEYALYELRGLDIGGPDFVYPPAALAAVAGGYGQPVELDRAEPAALLGYPLIITRRDPSASRPPAAYRLAWQGTYYDVWRRRAGAAPAIRHAALHGSAAASCRTIEDDARLASAHFPRTGTTLAAAAAAEIVRIPVARASHPARWGHQRGGLVMNAAGRLTARFVLPAGGPWELWVQGQIMPTVELRVDGRALAHIGGQLSGNSLVPNAVPPIRVHLAAGPHLLSVIRGGSTLAPGDGGSAVLDALFLTPAASDGPAPLDIVATARWRALCRRPHQWVELLPPSAG